MELKSVFVFCARRRGILGEWLEDMVALEEMVTVLGGSSHHYDTSNLPACCVHIGASSGVLCALVGEKGGRCGDGARMLLAQQVDFGVVSEPNVRLRIGSGSRH